MDASPISIFSNEANAFTRSSVLGSLLTIVEHCLKKTAKLSCFFGRDSAWWVIQKNLKPTVFLPQHG